jgi:glycosidase
MLRRAIFPLLLLLVPALPAAAQQHQLPEWARGCIWYRIIPDRFWNADSGNDATERDLFPDGRRRWSRSAWTANWYELTETERAFSESFYVCAPLRQYGGDIDGIIARLPYLDSLGVDGILLTPPFEAGSYHKYDIISYHHIDRHFGPVVPVDTALLRRERPEDPKTWYFTAADRKFLELVRALHERGKKVVVDVQFAHVGANFWAFRDLLEKQEKSVYADWFYVDEWDRPETPEVSEFRYKSMWGISAFPVLRRDSLALARGPRDYIFASVRRWMDPDGDGNPSDGIDGWRVELAGELSPAFWGEWMAMVRAINPQCFVMGGPMPGGAPTPFHVEDNDIFTRNVSLFFLNERITPTQLDNAVATMHGGDYLQADAHMNRIGNHETDRLASMCVNRAVAYETANSFETNPAYLLRPPSTAEELRRRQLLLLFQFTCPGSPLIYYGDEAGMWGGDDPDCRKPMLWRDLEFDDECARAVNGDTASYPVRVDSSVSARYHTLIRLRREHIALRQGAMKTMLLDDVRMLYGYERNSGADRAYLLFNLSNVAQECRLPMRDVPAGARVDAPLEGLRFFTEREGLVLVVPPLSGTILIPAI